LTFDSIYFHRILAEIKGATSQRKGKGAENGKKDREKGKKENEGAENKQVQNKFLAMAWLAQ